MQDPQALAPQGGEALSAGQTTALWALLARRAALFTGGESTSLRGETAAELLAGIRFTLALVPGGEEELDARFAAGQRRLAHLVARAGTLLHAAQRTACAQASRCYRDTLAALPAFFKAYNPRFFAHRIPCDIDYPLLLPVDETLQGVLYIGEYLRRLVAENSFCAAFAPEAHTALLRAHSPLYEELLLNITQPLLCTALALQIAGSPLAPLALHEGDLARLAAILTDCNDVPALLQSAGEELLDALPITDGYARRYLLRAARSLAPNLQTAAGQGTLAALLPAPRYTAAPKAQFVPPPAMADEALRPLLAEMASCRHTGDKLAMLRRHFSAPDDVAAALTSALEPAQWAVALSALSDEMLAAVWHIGASSQPPARWANAARACAAALPAARRAAVLRLVAAWQL